MLKAKNKLNSVEFSKVFFKGKKLHSDNLMVTYLSGMPQFKAAVVVSKKQTKTAILRNYKRRVVFNAIDSVNKEYAQNTNGVHLVVMVKKGSLGISYAQIEKEIGQLIQRI